jgi:hypothetical protein
MVPPLKEDEALGAEMKRGSKMASTSVEPSMLKIPASGEESFTKPLQISFSHVQLYVDNVENLEVYKNLEKRLVAFDEAVGQQKTCDLEDKRKLWRSLVPNENEEKYKSFVPQNRDVIKQMMVGFGMRITGVHRGNGTKSFLVTSQDPKGIQMVVTAKEHTPETLEAYIDTSIFHHFAAGTFP